ncbi:MAG: hypothetical protein HND51_02235 [Chloroflexi bacterium]|nr:hypothetical protein [Chloroflexota bacterium]
MDSRSVGREWLGQRLRTHIIALFAIVLLGIVLRLYFFTGMVRGDDFNYAHTAYELAQGRSPLGIWAGSSRIGMYLPVSILYFLFGPSEVTTLAYPFAMSISSILLVYGLGRMFSTPEAGLLAAWLWAMFPLDIFLASDLLPDGLVATFSTAAVFFMLFALKQSTRTRFVWLFVSLTCISWSILIKPIAIIPLIFIVGYLFFYWYQTSMGSLKSKIGSKGQMPQHSILLLVVIVGVIAILIYGQLQTRPFLVTLARTAHDTSQFILQGQIDYEISGLNDVSGNLQNTNLLISLTPLFLVSIAYSLFARRAEYYFPLAWFGSLFFLYEWVSVSLNPLVYKPIESFVEARSALFMFVPLIIVAGGYLSLLISKKTIEKFLLALSFGLILVVLAAGNFLPNWEQGSFLASTIVLVGIASLLMPYLLTVKEQVYKNLGVDLFLIVLALALLSPTPPFHASSFASRRQGLANLRLAASEISIDQDSNIHTNAPLQLNYASSFCFGYDWSQSGQGQFRIFVINTMEMSLGDIVVFLGEVDGVPPNWQLSQRFGQAPQSSVFVFEVVEQP